MPLACFGAIGNVSVHWKHAEGIFLRYGIIVRVIFGGEIAFFSAELLNFFCGFACFFCLSWGWGWVVIWGKLLTL